MDIGNIRDPLGIWLIRVKLSVQQVLIFMYLLTKVYPLPAATYFRQ
jgi:hypothetical protein